MSFETFQLFLKSTLGKFPSVILIKFVESDPDYIFFAMSIYYQRHLRLLLNFAMHSVKPGTLTA